MSMSTYVVGFKPADDKWKKMKAVWDACEDAGIGIPATVHAFFDGEYPGDSPGMTVDICQAITEWSAGDSCGYEVDVTKLSKDVTVVRFFNSW